MASPRDRLAELMEDRRVDLDLTWDQVAALSGVHRETLRTIRQGTAQIRPLTKRGIERALQWQSGSIDAILAGDDPTPIDNGDEPGLHAVPEVGDERLDRLEASFTAAELLLQEIREGIADLRGRKRDSGT